ncbi:ABC-type transport system periplasmic substrate-binding protein [Halomonas sp. 59]|nr:MULTISPECIES: extracellular solute-binding protein [Halomonas]CAD5249797.1 ABC-type transport system periplasmic substrate-binding protein [Halomonas sp. I3]CAD5272288.1 ABC-type transport system periplasmic substrate-binding protein [Halomonas sp. 113]CAD5274049.1 ABC-type transport system periplasmic substrate-binding protein [Halomonas sp. 59]CAD5279555.1 ABC-type transport system periplasmic substrate-binding protein [Halomonas sp. 156]VXB87272.1 ABC-type transport system periplasmic su
MLARRLIPGLLAGLLVLATPIRAGVPDAADSLTVLSWGGAYEHAQRLALFTPFTVAHDVPVAVDSYNGGLTELRQAVAENDVPWDVLDMTRSEAMAACEEGLLEPLPPELAAPAPDGTPAPQDFFSGALGHCFISHSIFATVVAYRRDAFPGERPTRIADLFDQQRFPGPRALQRTPAANLEWALLSYRVPREELYRLLSTRRGLDLAFARLQGIDKLHWWEAGETPVRLLEEGQVVMASGYNGRFFAAMVERDLPIEILWDGQLQEHETWAIPRGAPNPEAAQTFIRFATTSERQVELARHIPYGPTRRSAAMQVTTHRDSGLDMRLHIPTHPINAQGAVTKDETWYARTQERIEALFRETLFREALTTQE